ncbi:MAG: hypothetical protein K2N06_10975 [Oscillospiraceae bacterium]|nr:hypothetical protein [Oscillospiraceae bacterium]
MKKVLAIILLIVGSLLVSYGISWLAIILALENFPLGIVIAVLIAAGDALLLEMLRHLFKRRFDLSMPMFLLCAYLPSIFCAVIGWIVFIVLKNAKYFTGFFAGLGEFLFVFTYSIAAGVLLVFGMIWLGIFTAVGKRRMKS